MRAAALSAVAATLLAAAVVSADVGHQEGKADSAAAGGKAAGVAANDDEPPIVHPDFKVTGGEGLTKPGFPGGSAFANCASRPARIFALRGLILLLALRLPLAPAPPDFSRALRRTENQPSTRKALFVEQFGDDWKLRWSRSEATKKAEGEDSDKANRDLWAYRGKWEVEEATVHPGLKGDRGLVLKTSAAHHAISAPFATSIDPAGKDLVVQYEVKMQKGLECGGAYLKLLQANEKEDIHAKEFTNETPYTCACCPFWVFFPPWATIPFFFLCAWQTCFCFPGPSFCPFFG
ncbi:MAG: Calreticulin family-domain-containing protein [Olpidium bornovanus]|uniref:Calreticulin family-domain-containing protein n=1 Tax=Olpidium bornovanus TaxID=278681 RepID=A0A8H8DMD4_9FUNG|nr:MAG: Calreticulin family-domain-containing protein [Olpidium bornovanus]